MEAIGDGVSDKPEVDEHNGSDAELAPTHEGATTESGETNDHNEDDAVQKSPSQPSSNFTRSDDWGWEGQLWEEQFLALYAYKEQHGHCRVTARYKDNPKLGRWVMTQRRQRTLLNQGRLSSLTKERIRRLDSLGFLWSLEETRPRDDENHLFARDDEGWEGHFKNLTAFKEEHGHTRVPNRYKTIPKLANWVMSQRRQFTLLTQGKKNSMTPERIQKLDSLGFTWSVTRAWSVRPEDGVTWDQKFHELKGIAKESSTVNPNPSSGNSERFRTIYIPPGKLGLAVKFYKEMDGAVIDKVFKYCAFKDSVGVGDRIMTIDGNKVLKAADLRKGNDRMRQLGICPDQNSTSARGRLPESPSDAENAMEDEIAEGGADGNMEEPSKPHAQPGSKEKGSNKRKGRKSKRDTSKGAGKKKKSNEEPSAQETQVYSQEEFNQWHASLTDYQKAKLAEYFKGSGEHKIDEWDHRCQQLIRYKEENGDCNTVPHDYKAPDDLTLGQWVDKQRQLYKDGKLSKERIDYLQSQGLNLNAPTHLARFTEDEEWDSKLRDMIKYKKIHGNADVPMQYPIGETLGQWVHNQRSLYEKGTLDSRRHAILAGKGFLFEPGRNVKKTIIDEYWQKNYNELCQFKLDHGHCDVPTDYKATSVSTFLDRWISKQRTLHRKKELSIHKIRLLEEIGLTLNARKKTAGNKMEQVWDDMYHELISWRDEHGDCLVPEKHGKLGRWVRVQRKSFKKGKLREDRLKRLLGIGFDFDPLDRAGDATRFFPPSPYNDSIFNSLAWMKNYEALKCFVQNYGHSNVPLLHKDDGIDGCLHTWVETQKVFYEKDELPPRNVEMLEDLGVDLNERSNFSASRHDFAWHYMFDALKQFYDEHGHTNIPLDYPMMDSVAGAERSLRNWLQRQREYFGKGKLTDDRKLKLESLGIELTRKSRPGRKRKAEVIDVPNTKETTADDDLGKLADEVFGDLAE